VKAAANKVVTIEYTLKNDAGEVLDTSEGGEPLSYIHGAEQIVPGLERALEGKGAGDEVQVVLAPADGYGSRDDKLVLNIPVRKLKGPKETKGRVAPGMRFHVQAGGAMRVGTVLAIKGDYATVDANHPLADQTLHFAVKVSAVRDATAEEREHGHVHGEGGHHHA